MSNTIEITPLNKGKTFAIPDKAFQRYKNGKYRRQTSENVFGNNSIIEGIEGYIFIKFSNKEERDEIITNFPDATAINEKTYENDFYIIVSPNHNDTDEINSNIGVFRGMIINPELYFSNEAQEQVIKGAEKTRGILDEK